MPTEHLCVTLSQNIYVLHYQSWKVIFFFFGGGVFYTKCFENCEAMIIINSLICIFQISFLFQFQFIFISLKLFDIDNKIRYNKWLYIFKCTSQNYFLNIINIIGQHEICINLSRKIRNMMGSTCAAYIKASLLNCRSQRKLIFVLKKYGERIKVSLPN